MKVVKVLLITLGVMLVLIGVGWQVWLKDQVAFARVANVYGAKQVCSCLYVAERPMDSCLDDFTTDIRGVRITDDWPRYRASVLGGLSSQGRFSPAR